jgi:hypothetical protein
MTSSIHEPAGGVAAATPAQALFAAEGLPFPPVPGHLAPALGEQEHGWYATRPMGSTPYDLGHFLAEVETQPDVPDYAVVGFDGHGINSWAVHYYLVGKSVALFIQLPWGGAYTDPEPARADIADMVDWAARLQSRLQQAEALHRIPDGMRLVVVASRFGRAGWRWIRAGRDQPATPWNPPAGMMSAILAELDDLAGGHRTLQS